MNGLYILCRAYAAIESSLPKHTVGSVNKTLTIIIIKYYHLLNRAYSMGIVPVAYMMCIPDLLIYLNVVSGSLPLYK